MKATNLKIVFLKQIGYINKNNNKDVFKNLGHRVVSEVLLGHQSQNLQPQQVVFGNHLHWEAHEQDLLEEHLKTKDALKGKGSGKQAKNE